MDYPRGVSTTRSRTHQLNSSPDEGKWQLEAGEGGGAGQHQLDWKRALCGTKGQNWPAEAMHQRTSDFMCNLLMWKLRHIQGK